MVASPISKNKKTRTNTFNVSMRVPLGLQIWQGTKYALLSCLLFNIQG